MASYLIFYIIAGLLLVIEAFTPGVFLFICFAVATAFTGLVDQFTKLDITYLLGIDLILSVLALFLVRPVLKTIIKIPHEGDSNYGPYSEKLIGREAMVFKIIKKAEPGVVKLLDFDETWLAKSLDGSELPQGITVKIEKIEGNHLIVSANA